MGAYAKVSRLTKSAFYRLGLVEQEQEDRSTGGRDTRCMGESSEKKCEY